MIRRDLFGEEDEGYMQDAELLESLALEKLNEAAESFKEEGFAWVQVRTTFDYSRRLQSTVSGRENAPSGAVAALMIALNLDMAEWWEATGENYLSHLRRLNHRKSSNPDLAAPPSPGAGSRRFSRT